MSMTIAQYLKNNNDNTLLLGVISRHIVVKYTEESLIYSGQDVGSDCISS